LLVLGGLLAGAAAQPAQAVEREEILRALRDNPDILLEALSQRKLELYQLAREGAEMARRQAWREDVQEALQNPVEVDIEPGRPVLGPEGAEFTLVEYSDFLCGACAGAADNIAKLRQRNPDRLRVVLKHYTGKGLGRQLALYFEAIGRQSAEKAWEFYHQVFDRQAEVKKDKLAAVEEIVAGLGLDRAALARDLADPALGRRIEADNEEAQRLKLGSTPTVVLGGVSISGAAPPEAMEEVMEMARRHRQDG
jgi:protein-disulfide isomerase